MEGFFIFPSACIFIFIFIFEELEAESEEPRTESLNLL